MLPFQNGLVSCGLRHEGFGRLVMVDGTVLVTPTSTWHGATYPLALLTRPGCISCSVPVWVWLAPVGTCRKGKDQLQFCHCGICHFSPFHFALPHCSAVVCNNVAYGMVAYGNVAISKRHAIWAMWHVQNGTIYFCMGYTV